MHRPICAACGEPEAPENLVRYDGEFLCPECLDYQKSQNDLREHEMEMALQYNSFLEGGRV